VTLRARCKSSLGDAKISLGDAKSSLGDAKSPLYELAGDALEVSPGDAQVLLLAGDLVPHAVAHNLMRLVAEGAGDDDDAADHELRTSAVEAYLEVPAAGALSPSSVGAN
jgi:hypothetical protein